MNPGDCFHLSVEIVLEIHAQALSGFGGTPGLRDLAMLESAIAAPQASWSGESPYRDLTEIAAAYLFFLCSNHPFMDGNKRVALASAIVFLKLNGMAPPPDDQRWEDLTMDLAAGHLDREATTSRLRQILGT